MKDNKPRFYRALLWFLIFLPLLLFWIDLPDLPVPKRGARGDSLRAVWSTLSQLAGLIAFTSLSVSFVLSSRFKPLERRLGGLDKMYKLHHRVGVVAFGFILAHPLLFALRFLPDRLNHFVQFWGPLHRELAINIGVVAFWLFLVLIVLTLVRRFPYNWWKQTHRFMGLVLVMAGWHMLTVDATPGRPVAHVVNAYLNYYLIFMFFAGIIAYLYKWVWVPLFREKYRYRVGEIQRMPPAFMKVKLIPVVGSFEYIPGQFAFVRFEQQNLSSEQHPFTLCSPPKPDSTNITIKVLGDFTRQLYNKLEEGSAVRLEGPYGQFTYKKGKKHQIWLAGGIGVTPFVCWLHDIHRYNKQEYRIDFYYCVHSIEESLYHRRVEQWVSDLPGINFHLICTGKEGHLTAKQISMKGRWWPEIYMCGPKDFVRNLERQLMAQGLPEELIHHEEFEFR